MKLVILDAGLLLWLFAGYAALMYDVEENGYHWVKTPLSAIWLMIGFLAMFFKTLQDAVESGKEKSKS